MDESSPPPVGFKYLTPSEQNIVIAVYALFSIFGLVLTHLIIITRFRLWHTNPILEKIPQLVNNPISQILSQGIGLIAAAQSDNDLYVIWLVILLIAYDNVFTATGCTLIEKGSERMSREYLFFTNCVFIGLLVSSYHNIAPDIPNPFFKPLLTLWALIVLKFIVRLISYKYAEKAYGVKNTNLVADYMVTEHTPGDITYDPKSMKGYKYLVIGEEMVHPIITPPLYTLQFPKKEDEKEVDDKIVTVEEVWECTKGLLKRQRTKDVCLSFALFKLIRRRFFGFPAVESKQDKTKKFVIDGLLSRESDDVFRILYIELGFLRDFFYTRYPIAFAFGFPIFSLVILVAMFAITVWISATAFHEKKSHNYYRDDPRMISEDRLTNAVLRMDYRITNGLLITIMLMEIFEVLTYLFSDWMKVITICKHVRSKHHEIPLTDKILGLFCKPRISNSLNNTIGQYSLLKSYDKGTCKMRVNNCVSCTTCEMLASKMPRGLQEDKAIVLSDEVKASILKALKANGGNFDNELALLKRNGVEKDFPWLVDLRTPLHAIMVCHIATSLCEIHPIKKQSIIDDTNCLFTCFTKCLPTCLWKSETDEEKAIKPYHSVASSLSKYCAYLVGFAPELLSASTYSSKLIFDQIVQETSVFFKEQNSAKEHYEYAMKPNNNKTEQIVEMGADLARYLMETYDDEKRWEVMADVWSELILFVAPAGYTSGHLEKLATGGEFITHLWALLYHAGIVTSDSEEFLP